MILSVDSSSVTAAAALTDGDKVVKSEFVRSGLTHSETLLPMIKRVMGDTDYKDLEYIAVTTGPGSFTGVRIGVATVKGLAFDADLPCKSVSAIESIAYNFVNENAVICVVMDARRMQFYNGMFKAENGVITRLSDDRAISLDELKSELANYDNVIIAGDGAKLFCDNANLSNITLCSEDKQYVKGEGVALAAKEKCVVTSAELMPVYLRLSQAERELKLKREK